MTIETDLLQTQSSFGDLQATCDILVSKMITLRRCSDFDTFERERINNLWKATREIIEILDNIDDDVNYLSHFKKLGGRA